MPRLTNDPLDTEVRTLSGWTIEAGELVKNYSFATFPEGVEFVRRIAALAEEAGHHPDIDIRYTKVTLRLSTHSEGGITERDVDFARRADGVVDAS